jgi:pimeloyl-ACP methyl ester carboxylesterase
MRPLWVNGVELGYAEYGSGPTVVVSAQQEFTPGGYLELLAGPPTNYHVFAIRLRRLNKQDEFPGEDENPRWYPRWANDVYAAIQSLGLSQFIYIGVSHGAVIGWHLAVEHPDLLRGLVAIVGVPPARSRGPRVPAGRASQMAARSNPASLRANVERLFGPPRDDQRAARRESLVRARVDRILSIPPEEAVVNLGIGFPDIATDEELLTVLAKVRVPVLMIGGMHDPWVTPTGLLRTTSAVRSAKLVMFEDESHLLALESPDKVVDEVKLFVNGLLPEGHG